MQSNYYIILFSQYPYKSYSEGKDITHNNIQRAEIYRKKYNLITIVYSFVCTNDSFSL